MDALWQEVNGEFKANHSCGHDAHMTIVMGLILQLKNMRWKSGTVRFIFQPAEEGEWCFEDGGERCCR